MNRRPDISIIIPTYNRDGVLLDTIEDCLSQTHKNIEVLVIDQTKIHEKDFTERLNGIQDKRLRYFYVDPPRVTAAKNFALKKAQASIALFLDDDVRLDPDLAKEHLAAHRQIQGLSAVAGRVLQKGFPIHEDVLRFDDLAVSRGVFTATKPAYTNAFPGGNSSLVVADALRVGGFDTRYYLNAFREESDMSMKMVRAGMRIYFEPKAVLTHLAAPSGGSRARKYNDIRDTTMFYRNELFFTLRHAKRRIQALRYKYREYCIVASRKTRMKRTLYFCIGICAAFWRMLAVRQTTSRERSV